MNFLKKKIKTVVHGKRNKDDDDDDFDNYVPEVPPHPSTLNDNGAPGLSSIADSNLFPAFQSTLNSISSTADSAVKSIVGFGLGAQDNQEPDESKKNLSLEEIKKREQEHKREEKEKLKQQEESKKDNEEWKFFLSLTAKVDAVTSKTQSVLTKLKDESAVNEISTFEDPCYQDKYDESAPKIAGGWIAFEEQEQFNPADPIFNQPPPEEKPATPVESVVDETTKKLARELIDDFGFTNPAPGIPTLPIESLSLVESDIDPFDTSFIDIEAIKSGKALKPAELIQNLDLSEAEFDPFDTSHIETSLPIKEDAEEEDVK